MDDTLVREFKTINLSKPPRGSIELLQKYIDLGEIISRYIIENDIEQLEEEPGYNNNHTLKNDCLRREDCERIGDYFGTSWHRILKCFSLFLVKDNFFAEYTDPKDKSQTVNYVLFGKERCSHEDRDLNEYYELAKISDLSLFDLANFQDDMLHNLLDNEALMKLIIRECKLDKVEARRFHSIDIGYDKKIVLCTVEDLVAGLLYYDRKEDEDLPLGSIEKMVKNGKVTIEEMIEAFNKALKEAMFKL